jgi:hypothetical protein
MFSDVLLTVDYDRTLTATDPSNKVELEKTYTTPVKTANNKQNKCYSVYHFLTSFHSLSA